MKFSLCIEPLFPERDFYERVALASALGFEAIEFWEPAGKDLTRLAHLASDHHIAIAACCANEAWKHPLKAPAEMVLPNLERSIHMAQTLDCPSLIVLSGDGDAADPAIRRQIVENLKRAAELVERAGVTLVVEALNSHVDHRGYYLNSAALGFDLLRQVDCEHIRLLYDIYHMQIMEGNLIATIQANISRIGHFHSAGVPGRHEHFRGEIAYREVLPAIEASGYQRYFGLEYWPSYDHQQSLKDVRVYLSTF